jgi:hypothetical protein
MSVTINGSAGVTTNSGAVYNGIQAGTAVASTSGTSIDFTSIPSWVKRVTVMFSGVSTNGVAYPWYIQIGPSSGIENTGYLSGGAAFATGVSSVNGTTGFPLNINNSASTVVHGAITLTLLNSTTNLWTASGVLGQSDAARSLIVGGSKSISGALSIVRITSNGTDTFDAGSINILYE